MQVSALSALSVVEEWLIDSWQLYKLFTEIKVLKTGTQRPACMVKCLFFPKIGQARASKSVSEDFFRSDLLSIYQAVDKTGVNRVGITSMRVQAAVSCI